MTSKRQSISVFFPAFNDAATIASLVTDALALLPKLAVDFEVLVVNDGSTDATRAVLNTLSQASSQIRIIHHETNQGYGAALRTGFAQASKDLIFYTDGDGQYDVSELVALHSLMTEGVDVVNGYKIKRSDNRRRIFIGRLYGRFARLLFRLPIRDVDCDFRLIRREALQQLELTSSSGAICVELVRQLHAAGCVFEEAPVHHYPRRHGRSQFLTFRRVTHTCFDFLALWLTLVALRPLCSGGQSRGNASARGICTNKQFVTSQVKVQPD